MPESTKPFTNPVIDPRPSHERVFGGGPEFIVPKPTPQVPPLTPAPAPINLNALIAPLDVMRGAVNNTYLGNFTEADAKGNVSRTVQITGWQDIMISEIAQDDNFGYNGSKAQFIRHMIEMGITYYQEQGMIKEERRGLFGDLLRAGKMLREDAERAKIRNDFSEHVREHDRALEVARMTGDWPLIATRLRRYMDAIESCENEAQRRILRSVFAESVATRTAVTSFNRWLATPERPPNDRIEGWEDSWPVIAEQWEAWYNSWGDV